MRVSHLVISPRVPVPDRALLVEIDFFVLEERARRAARAKKLKPTPWKNTSIEQRVRALLRDLKIPHVPQERLLPGWFGPVDIYVGSWHLAIECDGDYWHRRPSSQERDEKKNAALIQAGYNVLRLWEKEIRVMTKAQLFAHMEQACE